MKHALSILIITQLFLLYPFFVNQWHWAVCFIPSMLIALWYICYGLFIVCCIALIKLCSYYVKLKNEVE